MSLSEQLNPRSMVFTSQSPQESYSEPGHHSVVRSGFAFAFPTELLDLVQFTYIAEVRMVPIRAPRMYNTSNPSSIPNEYIQSQAS
jgi:hypothetical protein